LEQCNGTEIIISFIYHFGLEFYAISRVIFGINCDAVIQPAYLLDDDRYLCSDDVLLTSKWNNQSLTLPQISRDISLQVDVLTPLQVNVLTLLQIEKRKIN
jgi:hypothetical protein